MRDSWLAGEIGERDAGIGEMLLQHGRGAEGLEFIEQLETRGGLLAGAPGGGIFQRALRPNPLAKNPVRHSKRQRAAALQKLA